MICDSTDVCGFVLQLQPDKVKREMTLSGSKLAVLVYPVLASLTDMHCCTKAKTEVPSFMNSGTLQQ